MTDLMAGGTMRRLPILVALTLVACGEEGLDPAGYHWEVEILSTENLCDPDLPPTYEDAFVYSLFIDGSHADLKIGEASFASGTISGCRLTYESYLVGERRGPNDEYWVQWILTGEATIRQGGSACDLDPHVDWFGTEVFTVEQASEELGYPPNCTYTTEVEGVYLGHGDNL
ncbi:MAG: hypothetical protein JXB39_02465 [Deltaproteobacteria bacterium]|nr:hypothetical protein [Deltaproteobacteria bacterium]